MMTRGEGGGGGDGEYNWECLFHNDRDDNEYNKDNKYDNKKDGKGLRRGAEDGGEFDYDGHDVVYGPSFSGMGWRMSIVGPHTTAAIINNDNVDNDCHCGGEVSCLPPPLVRPVLPDATRCCQCCQPQ
jgi:hypothetical protein